MPDSQHPEPTPSTADLVDGRYRIRGRLDDDTFVAEHELLGRKVALRCAEIGSGHAAEIDRRARALARVSHPNVVHVYSIGRDATRTFVATELVVGETLSAFIAGGPLAAERVVTIVGGLARGLDALHAANVPVGVLRTGQVVVDERTRRAVIVDVDPLRGPLGLALRARPDIEALAHLAFALLSGLEQGDAAEACRARVPLSSFRPELSAVDAPLARAGGRTSCVYASCEELANEIAAAVRATSRSADERSGVRHVWWRVRAVVFARQEPARSRILATTERTLSAPGDRVEIENVMHVRSFLAALARRPIDLLVIDDEAAGAASDALLQAVRALDERPELLLVNRTHGSAAARDLGARELAPPLDVHLLGSALGRIGARLAERRASGAAAARGRIDVL